MSEFSNVTVIKEANVYFGGKVVSRTVVFPDGTHKTLGTMLPGEYEFDTKNREIMEILSGEMDVRLPGASAWKSFQGGDAFEVLAEAKFHLRVKTICDYCCSYIK